MTLVFHPEALNELIEAADFYEGRRPGLGTEFESAVRSAFDVIQEHPLRWPLHRADVRRYRLKRFPFAILYRASSQTLIVIAIMHLSRRPGYWTERL